MLNDLSLLLKLIQHVNKHAGLSCKAVRIQCLVCALFLIKSLLQNILLLFSSQDTKNFNTVTVPTS